MSTALIAKAQFSPEQIQLIKRTIFKDASDDELALFLHVCQRTGLDPFARQIYAVKRKNQKTGEYQMTLQTSIDGFRLIAARSDAYAGRDEAIFEYDPKSKTPKRCKLTIYKLVQGQRCAFTATANWDEYYPGDLQGFMWKKLPETMLEKCCESKALRMAFPAELSGIYSTEEMAQADSPRIAPEHPGEGNGIVILDDPNKIQCGTFAGRKWTEVPLDKLREHIAKVEDRLDKARAEGKPVEDRWLKHVERGSAFIAEIENSELEVEAH